MNIAILTVLLVPRSYVCCVIVWLCMSYAPAVVRIIDTFNCVYCGEASAGVRPYGGKGGGGAGGNISTGTHYYKAISCAPERTMEYNDKDRFTEGGRAAKKENPVPRTRLNTKAVRGIGLRLLHDSSTLLHAVPLHECVVGNY